MRLKKTILLVDGDDRRASLRRFVLEQQRGYAVIHRTSLEQCETARHPAVNLYGVDLVMVSDTVPLHNAIMRRARQINPETRAILLQDRSVPRNEDLLADAVAVWDTGHAVDILSLVRLLMARKRGPKKPLQRATPPQVRSAA